jgi:hypothetical protein
MVLLQPGQNQLTAKHHPGEQVVEVMGNASDEAADNLHFVGFPQLLLGLSLWAVCGFLSS